MTELRSEVSLISGVPCFVLRGRMSDPGAPPVSMTVFDFHVGRRRYGLRTIGAADDSVADARAKRFFESFELIP